MRKEFKEEIFKEFLNNREIIFNALVDDDIIELVSIQIIKFNNEDDKKEKEVVGYDRNNYPIKIYINSCGGNAYNCLSVMSVIENSKTPVYTYVLGKALSAGFFISICGHKRFVQKYSTLLYHQPNCWIGWKNQQELLEKYEEGQRIQNILDKLVINKTNIIQEKLKEINERKIDWYISGEEAIELGIADEII